MVKKKSKQEPQIEWVFDWKQTLAQNSLYIPMFLAVMSFCYIGLAVSIVRDQLLQIMGLIFTLFFTLKMFAWVGQPRIALMQRLL